MSNNLYVSLVASAILAAIGQVLFRLGALGRVSPTDFLNVWIFAGAGAYGLGTILWIYSLSRAPLTVVYPFTALTFVAVYLSGVGLLGEQTTIKALIGVVLVLVGLYCIADA
jgi:undecaprenyl phosphate-alpha-L-ara4N flippase subunit ArnE